MTHTAPIPQRQTAQDRFEGIGPYAREQFRLAPGPATPSPVAAPCEAPMSLTATPLEIETLDQRTYVSSRWCDIGISLIVLGSSAAALFRLVCLGQP